MDRASRRPAGPRPRAPGVARPECVGFVRQQHHLRRGRHDLGLLHDRVAALRPLREDVGAPADAQQIVRVGVAADRHPRALQIGQKTRVGGAAWRAAARASAAWIGSITRARARCQARPGPPARRAAPARRHAARIRDPHVEPRLEHALDVAPGVLLVVRDHQVRAQLQDPLEGRVLGAADPGQPRDRVGRMHTPVGDAHDTLSQLQREERLAEARHQRHDAARRRARAHACVGAASNATSSTPARELGLRDDQPCQRRRQRDAALEVAHTDQSSSPLQPERPRARPAAREIEGQHGAAPALGQPQRASRHEQLRGSRAP